MRYYWKITHRPRLYKAGDGSTIPGLYAEPLGHEDLRAQEGIARDLITLYLAVPPSTYWVSYTTPHICSAWVDGKRRVYTYDPVKKRGTR